MSIKVKKKYFFLLLFGIRTSYLILTVNLHILIFFYFFFIYLFFFSLLYSWRMISAGLYFNSLFLWKNTLNKCVLSLLLFNFVVVIIILFLIISIAWRSKIKKKKCASFSKALNFFFFCARRFVRNRSAWEIFFI